MLRFIAYSGLGAAFGLGLHQAGAPTLLAAAAGCLAYLIVGWLARIAYALGKG